MQRWQFYFKSDHLPPHLRAISEPFATLARSIVEWDRGDTVVDPVIDDFGPCRLAAMRGDFDHEEKLRALHALDVADIRWFEDPNMALEWLLFAKDCAVRAHLPNPETPQCG